MLLAALAALAEAVPAPVALAAAEARGGSGGRADCLRARLEVPAAALKVCPIGMSHAGARACCMWPSGLCGLRGGAVTLAH